MSETELRQLFKNSSDCFADTWFYHEFEDKMIEGEVILAMTENRFIEVWKLVIGTEPKEKQNVKFSKP